MNLPRRKKARGKGPQERNPSHLRWIRGFECLVCHKTGQRSISSIEAAHVRTGTDGGMGVKPSDQWTVPLCAVHHSHQHQIGEAAFERKYGVNLKEEAMALYRKSPHRMMSDKRTEGEG